MNKAGALNFVIN